jgi:hypothetical protein
MNKGEIAMTMTVTKVADKPIIIVASDGQVTAEERAASLLEVNSIADTIEGTVYRIIDVREHNMDFPTFITFLKGALQKEKGSIGDPRFYNVFVGREKTSMMVRDAMQKKSEDGNPIPLFSSIEDALNHIQRHINKE